MNDKIQKVLANAGVGSRRQIEQWIREGRVIVDGRKAEIGERVSTSAHLKIDGREIELVKSTQKRQRVLLYHKPEGEICSRSDPEGRPTIFERLPLIRNGRWITIGRLDLNTTGLLLLTNDGELANKLMHPSYEIEREYAVRIHGQVAPDVLTKLRKGVELDDGLAKFDSVTDAGGTGANHWYHVMVKEGRNRLVRRLWESQGLEVSRLMRIRFGPISLPPTLKRGQWLELEKIDINNLSGRDVVEEVVEAPRGDSKARGKQIHLAPTKKPRARFNNRNKRRDA
jgi:23S rRNA pseudouridine2605 synthase